ncbi:MAG: recombination protein RecR [Flavobacteriales bacterium]|nr:recombination protein RecR [Flavobacteriales bacterium]
MNFSSKYIEQAVEQLSSLPGIGKRTALRLALDLLKRDQYEVDNFIKAIVNLKENVSTCKKCHNVSDEETCSICKNPSRIESLICVVEDMRDVLAIENTQQYNGKYHVLGGAISPMDGIGPSELSIESLVSRVETEDIKEVILALSATMEGDTTNFYLFRKLAASKVKVSTLSRGISVGDELHYADEITLGRSIINRTPFETSIGNKIETFSHHSKLQCRVFPRTMY